jgi:arylsulfatase
LEPLRNRALAAATLLLVACGPREEREAAGGAVRLERTGARPSVLLMMADDLGWSDVGCYGGEVPTPAIDGLAAEGLRFRDFYTNGLCGPTRASLLYGVYCQQVGHRGRLWDDTLDTSRAVALPALLGAAGYRTLMVGKWQGQEHPLDAGFERFFGPLSSGPISYFDAVRPNPLLLDREPWQPPEDFFLTEALADHAVRFLEQGADDPRPFFLYLAFVAPHWPLHAREADIAPFRALYAGLGWDRAHDARVRRQRSLGLVPEAWTPAPRPARVAAWDQAVEPAWQAERMAVYAAQVAGLDRAVGRVLAAVEDLGAREDTLVLFLSDNGADAKGGQEPDPSDLLGNDAAGWRLDGGAMRAGSGPEVLPGPRDSFAAYGPAWAWVSNAPFRGTKWLCHEGGLRAPLIARLPGVVAEPGGITTLPAHVFDLYATCLDLAGVTHPALAGERGLDRPDGLSLRSVLGGDAAPLAREQLAFATRGLALRAGDWKLVTDDRKSPWQLYDLAADGGETNDLAAGQPERVERLAEEIQAWRERVDER